jgi:hypothetical protein
LFGGVWGPGGMGLSYRYKAQAIGLLPNQLGPEARSNKRLQPIGLALLFSF